MSVRIGIVGGGWRAEFYVRIARQLPDEFELVGITTRTAESRNALSRRWAITAYASVAELVRRAAPSLIVVAAPDAMNATLIAELVELGAHVLAETPPATSVSHMRKLWALVGAAARVQVAEQYPLLPSHASRAEVVRRGYIGTPTSVQISSTHSYHAVSLMRAIMGARFDPVRVRASRHEADLLNPLDRQGWTGDATPTAATNTIATLDFPEGLGLYDFTDNQWHNQLRHRRIVIRGSLGEVVDESIVRWGGPETIINSRLERRQLGYDLDLDGYDTHHISFEGAVVYRNPFLGLRLMDEEIAIGSLMRAAGAWATDAGPAPYPLAEALQDQLLGLAITQAADSGIEVRTGREPWGW